MERSFDDAGQWPALPLQQWKDTCATFHMWTQIVGKIRLALTPIATLYSFALSFVGRVYS
jgi:uncharacterized protein DUF5996